LLSINLAICWKLRVSRATSSVPRGRYRDNVPGADNQQERLDGYISGYVDGEGCFAVSINRNPSCRTGYQLIPEFHVSQNGDRAQVLHLIQERFGGCGYIKSNGRKDRALVYVVRRRRDLIERVIPFFERTPMLSSKMREFERFAAIVMSMEDGAHRTDAGFAALLESALSMNGGGRLRAARWRALREQSSRILRDCTPDRADAPEDTVRAAWRHAESGRNDLATGAAGAGSNNTVGPYLPWALES
jgi:LAGLIDADG endonuclease